jgi:hypothetical protein
MEAERNAEMEAEKRMSRLGRLKQPPAKSISSVVLRQRAPISALQPREILEILEMREIVKKAPKQPVFQKPVSRGSRRPKSTKTKAGPYRIPIKFLNLTRAIRDGQVGAGCGCMS